MEYIKIEQDNFIVWLPVVIIKQKPFKVKKESTLKRNKVFKPSYK